LHGRNEHSLSPDSDCECSGVSLRGSAILFGASGGLGDAKFAAFVHIPIFMGYLANTAIAVIKSPSGMMPRKVTLV
jgi:hypothetical protein